MIYILGGTVKFRTDDCSFYIGNESEPEINLSITMARLFIYLINNHGEVCTRDGILENVWERYGLRTSNNSLNKYISDLRRSLSSLGLGDAVIVTVPRFGFMLSMDLSVTKEGDSQPPAPKKITTKNKKEFFPNISLFHSALFIVFCSICFLSFRVSVFNLESDDSQVFNIGRVNNCDLNSFDFIEKERYPFYKKVALDFIEKKHILCHENSIFFIKVSDPVIHGFADRVFLSRCTKSITGEKKYSSCDSYYEDNYSAPN
jgi:DNA-binding winged helix-turn-helix (wHTH) protein